MPQLCALMTHLLRKLLMSFTRRELQYGALDLIPVITALPSGTKASIVDRLISQDRRRDVCLYFLNKARKATIDSLIPPSQRCKSKLMLNANNMPDKGHPCRTPDRQIKLSYKEPRILI